MADPFPLFVPPEARRLFQSESLLRRLAFAGRWDERSSLVELYGSLGGLALAKALKCGLMTVEADARSAEVVTERVKAAGISGQVRVVPGNPTDVSLLSPGVDGLFCLGRVLGHVDTLAAQLRPVLTPSTGRLALTCVLKVGRQPPKGAVEAWATRLGRAPVSPREAMMSVEAKGFEPEICESLGEPELDELYKELDTLLGRQSNDSAGAKALREEIALHKTHGGKTGITYGVIVARRKEPGEKPPINRDAG